MAPSGAATAAGHARTVRRGSASRGPRRISGPARTPRRNALQAMSGGAVALPRQRTRTKPRGALGARLLRRLVALPDSVWLGRLLSGRLWIGLVAVSLIGIVFMQVSLLKLNAGIGRAVETTATLERQNAGLRAAVSRLESNDRIQQFAQGMGMFLPAAGEVTFLGPDGRHVGGDAPAVAGDTAPASGPAAPPTGTAPDPAAQTTTIAPPATTTTTTTTTTTAPPSTTATAAPPATTTTGGQGPTAVQETTTAGGGVAAPSP